MSRILQLVSAHKSRQCISNKDKSNFTVSIIIWKDEYTPEHFLKWQESWKRTHRTCKYYATLCSVT